MGRKPKSALKSATDPQREEVTAIRAKLLHGHRDWRIVRLRELILLRRRATDIVEQMERGELTSEQTRRVKEIDKLERSAKITPEQAVAKLAELSSESGPALPDNYLSGRAAANAEIAQRKRYVLLDESDSLWREMVAEFERAVIDGDYDWFKRQAKVIRSGDTRSDTDKARDRFEAAVARELEMAFWEDARAEERKRNPDIEDATLESAGKRTGVTAQQVLDTLQQRREERYLFVEGCRFESARRAREAITGIARLLRYELAG